MTPGSRLGPYELIERIGAGGRGEVWKARDTRLDRIIAVKLSKTEFSQRFEREARAIAAVLDDSARAIANDGVAASLQRQQKRGLPCTGATCDYYSRHAEAPRPRLRRLTYSETQRRMGTGCNRIAVYAQSTSSARFK
jgi:serine/threonine protein kinase